MGPDQKIHESDKPSALRIWLAASRPKTLPAGIVPVLVAGIMAARADLFHLPSFLAALAGSILIQIGTNFANDLFDYKKQTDREDRIGPTRVTQAGLVSPKQIAAATIIVFGLALLIGIYLVTRGGWPIVIIGLASIVSGILYTAGPMALGYIGLGDFFVLIFYGPVALAGTYYVQSLTAPEDIILAGIPFGMISTAILTVNNLRDIRSDSKSGKNTLAVRFGRRFAVIEYALLLIGAAILAVWLGYAAGKLYLFLTLIYIIPAIFMIALVAKTSDGIKLNKALAQTGGLLLLYGLLFGIGWWL